MNKGRFSKTEEKYLATYFTALGKDECAKSLNRPANLVYNKAFRMGLIEKKIGKNREPSLGQPTECKCPKCRETFIETIFWTGRSRPWKICDTCYDVVKMYETDRTGV